MKRAKTGVSKKLGTNSAQELTNGAETSAVKSPHGIDHQSKPLVTKVLSKKATATPDAHDDDGDALTVTIVSSMPTHAVTGGDGTASTTSSGTSLSTSTVTPTVVTPANTSPAAAADDYVATEDEALVVSAVSGVLANDSDVEGDALTVTAFDAQSIYGGTVAVNPDGSFTYTPDQDFNGSDSFSYTADDGHGGTATASVTLTVAAVNDAPVGTNNTVTAFEDTAYTFTTADFGFTDPSDAPNALLNVRISTLPGAGSLTLAGAAVTSGQFVSAASITAGNLRFTSAANANGAAHAAFTFQVQDDGGTATGGVDLDATPRTMTVNVTSVNDAPVGTNKTVTTLEDTAYTFTTVDFGFTDPSDAPNALLNIRVTALPAAGSLTLSGAAVTAGQFVSAANITAGNLKFTPAANANGAAHAAFTFRVQDDGGTATGGVDLDATPRTMTVNVTFVNDAPVGTNKTVTTLEDTAYTFTTVDFGFTDPSDAPNALLNIRVTALPAAGSLTLSGAAVTAGQFVSAANITAGNLKFTPAANANGAAYSAFTFQVQDDGGTANGGVDLDTSARTMTVNVTSVNDAPVAVADSYAAAEDQTLVISAAAGVLANDSDADADTLTVTSFDALSARGGSVVVNPNGSFTYTPAANFNGSDSFGYTVTDGRGGVATASVTLTVAAVNDPPVAAADSYTTTQNAALVVNTASSVLANDSDVDGDALTVTGFDALSAQGGTVAMNPDGSFTYTPALNFKGSDSFAYTVGDGAGGFATANATVAVMNLARGFWFEHLAPITANDSYAATQDSPLVVNAVSGVLANDYDPEGSALTVGQFDALSANGGNVAINADGSFTYTPASGFTGADSFAYTARDGDSETSATVETFVYGPRPAQFESILQSTAENAWVKLNVNQFQDVWVPREAINDSGNPSYIIGAWSSAAWDANRNEYIFWGGGHAAYGGNEVYTWSAVNLTWERASFPSAIRRVVIDLPGWYETVDGPDHSPIPSHTYDNLEFLEVGDRLINFGGAAFNTGGPFVDTNGAWTGPYFWDPSKADPNKVGGLTGSQVNPALFPEIVGGEMWENRNTLYPGDPRPRLMLDGTTDYVRIDGKDVVFVNDTSQRLFKYTVPDVNDPSKDTWQLVGNTFDPYQGTGAGAYDPDHNIYVRTSGTSFTYWDLDRPGSTNVIFTPSNPNGEFVLQGGTGMEYDPVRHQFVIWQGDVSVWYLKAPEELSESGWTLQRAPTSASPAPTIPDLFTGVLGKWDYIDQYDVFIGVNNAFTGDVWVYKPPGWTPQAPGFAPVAAADTYVVGEDETLNVNGAAGVLANDRDFYGNALTVTAFDAQSTHGGTVVMNSDGSFTYTPAQHFNGSDSFAYTISNGTAEGTSTATASVTLTIAPVNDAPVAVGDTYAATEDQNLIVNAAAGVLANDTDVEGDTLTVTSFDALTARGGTVVVNSDGAFTYTPAANINGADSFSYTVDDGHGGVASASVTLAVTAVNDAPVGTSNTVTTLEDTTYTFVAADFGFTDPSDAPNALLNVRISALPGAGNLTLSGAAVTSGQFVSAASITAGNLRFTPAANANGAGYAAFTFQVQDDGGTANGGVDLDTPPRTLTVNVTSVNDAPLGTNNAVTTLEDTAYTFTTADFGFTDPSDAANVLLNVRISTLSAAGSLTLSGAAVSASQFVSAANITAGNLKFTPAANANGAGYAAFTFEVQDDGGTANGGVDLDTSARAMTVNVTSVNDAPAAVGDSYAATKDQTLIVNAAAGVLANDSDVDADVLAVTAFDALSANGGTVTMNADGSFTYTPAPDFTGSDSFSYTETDGHGGEATASVNMNVAAVNSGNALTANTTNDAPTALGNDALANGSPSGSVISNFDSSSGGDALDLRDILGTFNGYAGANASAGGYLPFDRADNISVVGRHNGGATAPITLVTTMNELLTTIDTGSHAF